MFSEHLPAKAQDQESKERNTLDINLNKKHNLRHNKTQSLFRTTFVIVTFQTNVHLIQHCWKDRLSEVKESY